MAIALGITIHVLSSGVGWLLQRFRSGHSGPEALWMAITLLELFLVLGGLAVGGGYLLVTREWREVGAALGLNKPIECEASYSGCIPTDATDLDCQDVDETDIRINGADPYAFDGDRDGWGCEATSRPADEGYPEDAVPGYRP